MTSLDSAREAHETAVDYAKTKDESTIACLYMLNKWYGYWGGNSQHLKPNIKELFDLYTDNGAESDFKKARELSQNPTGPLKFKYEDDLRKLGLWTPEMESEAKSLKETYKKNAIAKAESIIRKEHEDARNGILNRQDSRLVYDLYEWAGKNVPYWKTSDVLKLYREATFGKSDKLMPWWGRSDKYEEKLRRVVSGFKLSKKTKSLLEDAILEAKQGTYPSSAGKISSGNNIFSKRYMESKAAVNLVKGLYDLNEWRSDTFAEREESCKHSAQHHFAGSARFDLEERLDKLRLGYARGGVLTKEKAQELDCIGAIHDGNSWRKNLEYGDESKFNDAYASYGGNPEEINFKDAQKWFWDHARR